MSAERAAYHTDHPTTEPTADEPQHPADPQPDDSGLDALPRKPGPPLADPRRQHTGDPRHRRPGPQRQQPQ